MGSAPGAALATAPAAARVDPARGVRMIMPAGHGHFDQSESKHVGMDTCTPRVHAGTVGSSARCQMQCRCSLAGPCVLHPAAPCAPTCTLP